MPLIRIENWPAEWKPAVALATELPPRLHALVTGLRTACVQAGVPGITSEKCATVVLGGQQYLKENATLLIIVEGLFDTPERTKEIRDHLAISLARAGRKSVGPHWQVEVLVNRFNLMVDSYAKLIPEGSDSHG